jgi:hypothetical protein
MSTECYSIMNLILTLAESWRYSAGAVIDNNRIITP